MVALVSLVGPSAAGKTTLARELCRRAGIRVVTLVSTMYPQRCHCTVLRRHAHGWPHIRTVQDNHYLPPELCPTFALDSLPWPDGVPEAFARRGNHDMNVPAAFDWSAVLADVRSTIAGAEDAGEPAVLVEGLSLFADHPGAAAVRGLCQRHTLLL